MKKLLAYHSKKEIKEKYKKRMLDHIKMDELIQGKGFEEGKGCFVGCTLNNYDHSAFPEELGIPEEIAHLSDAIFEGLPQKESVDFSREFHDQIKLGSDLSMVWPKFVVAILSDKDHGVLNYVQGERFKEQKEAVENVATLYKEWVATNVKPPKEKWDAARAAARDAGAARAAARAAGAAARAAGAAAWKWMAEKLFELLRQAPVESEK